MPRRSLPNMLLFLRPRSEPIPVATPAKKTAKAVAASTSASAPPPGSVPQDHYSVPVGQHSLAALHPSPPLHNLQALFGGRPGFTFRSEIHPWDAED